MAVLDGHCRAGPCQRAQCPGASVSTPEKFLGEKVVVESSEEAGGVTFATRIALNVSTVESHPGKTLAGCSYTLDVK